MILIGLHAQTIFHFFYLSSREKTGIHPSIEIIFPYLRSNFNLNSHALKDFLTFLLRVDLIQFATCRCMHAHYMHMYARVAPIEILQIDETSDRPLCMWQRQSGNSVRVKERDDGRFFLSLSTRTALERETA